MHCARGWHSPYQTPTRKAKCCADSTAPSRERRTEAVIATPLAMGDGQIQTKSGWALLVCSPLPKLSGLHVITPHHAILLFPADAATHKRVSKGTGVVRAFMLVSPNSPC